jgi:hypothetical protein
MDPRPLEFVESTWPLVVVRLPQLMNSIKVIQLLTANFERVHARKERFAVMIDCSAVVKFPGAIERKMLTDWMADERRQKVERELTVGAAIVLTSGPMRAFVSAMNWIRRPITPQVWKATPAEALEWCCERMIDAGMQLTPAIEALRARGGV